MACPSPSAGGQVSLTVHVAGEEEERTVFGLTEATSCQEIIYALAHAMGKKGRFVLVEQWRSSERSLAPQDKPVELLRKWGEHGQDVKFVLKHLGDQSGTGPVQAAVGKLALEQNSRQPFLVSPNSATLRARRPGEGGQTAPDQQVSVQRSRSQDRNLTAMPTTVATPKMNVRGLPMEHAAAEHTGGLQVSPRRKGPPPPYASNGPISRRPLPSYDEALQRQQQHQHQQSNSNRPSTVVYASNRSLQTSTKRNYQWPASKQELVDLAQQQARHLDEQMNKLEALQAAERLQFEELSNMAVEKESLVSSNCSSSPSASSPAFGTVNLDEIRQLEKRKNQLDVTLRPLRDENCQLRLRQAQQLLQDSHKQQEQLLHQIGGLEEQLLELEDERSKLEGELQKEMLEEDPESAERRDEKLADVDLDWI